MPSHLVQRKASNIKLSDRHHSVTKQLYIPIIHKSIEPDNQNGHRSSVLQERLLF